MHTSRLVSLVLVFLLVLTPALAARHDTGKNAAGGLQLHKNLPRDPVVVLGMLLEDPEGGFQTLAGLFERLSVESVEPKSASPLGGLNPELAALLRTELLPRIGPELTLALDLPPIDEAVAALQISRDDALSTLLGRIGLLTRVRDRTGLDAVVRRWVFASGGQVADAEGLTEAVLPIGLPVEEPAAVEPTLLRVYWAFEGDRWAVGFSPEWVREALQPRPKGRRLTDGADFKRVFARLDPRPSDLVYVNLPKLHELVAGSQVVQMVLQTNTEIREFVGRFFTSETMSIGLGSTSVRLEDGVRTTNFGPPWMSGTAVSGGTIAALALPNLLSSLDRGKTRRTLTDIEAIANACEGFSADSRTYPGPTHGWVPVDKIATFLEPVYIAQMPRTDGWENPILYWSDGGTYRIISTGRDGRIDRDWTGPVERESSEAGASDIVFGDGRLLAGPAALTDE